jgi:SPOR domain
VNAVRPLERECPDCGASTAPGQEYCLECGHRLPADAGAAGLPRRRLAPGGAGVALLATAAVALIAVSTVSAVQLSDDDGESTLIATSPQPEVLPPTETVPAGESVPATTPEAELATEPPPAAPSPRASRRLIAWPRDGSGWTIVLASVPVAPGNRAVAIRQARDAVDQGLRQVGILTSATFSSLHPGYLVVFSGVYANRSAAEQALSRAKAAGYDAGYTREIVP